MQNGSRRVSCGHGYHQQHPPGEQTETAPAQRKGNGRRRDAVFMRAKNRLSHRISPRTLVIFLGPLRCSGFHPMVRSKRWGNDTRFSGAGEYDPDFVGLLCDDASGACREFRAPGDQGIGFSCNQAHIDSLNAGRSSGSCSKVWPSKSRISNCW